MNETILFPHICNEIQSFVVVKMQAAVFWVMTMCILLGHSQHFGGTHKVGQSQYTVKCLRSSDTNLSHVLVSMTSN